MSGVCVATRPCRCARSDVFYVSQPELKGSGAGSRRDDGVEAALSMAGNPKKHPRKGCGVDASNKKTKRPD